MIRTLCLAALLAAPAQARDASVVAGRDIAAVAGKVVVVPLSRAPARLFIADQRVATASSSGAMLFITGRAAGETGWVASDARGGIIDQGNVRVRYDEAGLEAVMAAESRSSRLFSAQARAARLPALMTVPMIAFILLPLFVVLIGPAVVEPMG